MNSFKPLTFDLFKIKEWFFVKYDGRKRIFKGIDKKTFALMKERHFARAAGKKSAKGDFIARCKERRRDIAYFAEIPYLYNGDGLDDYSKIQRPCKGGVGYASICPGERSNNYYVDDPITVRYLRGKYEKYFNTSRRV